MRIAYIAPYFGPEVLRRRPCQRNFGLGAKMKIELLAEMLLNSGHEVEIISQAEVIERKFKLYPGFAEPERFHSKIPVEYSSALPVRFVNGWWSSRGLLNLFKSRHAAAPFDLAMVYNLKPPQLACGNHALDALRLPVVLEYEDDQFLDEVAAGEGGFTARYYLSKAREFLKKISGSCAVSPYLLDQSPSSIPKLLIRGVVSEELAQGGPELAGSRKNWVVFSGTHSRRQGLEQLVKAWLTLDLPDWELHLAGKGAVTDRLQDLANGRPGIVFHGYIDRKENARLLRQSKIGIVPRELDENPGNVFAFKTVECLAAGLHVITTPMGTVEPELEAGITYIKDNAPETIAAGLREVIAKSLYNRTAEQAALDTYSGPAVSKALNQLLIDAQAEFARREQGGERLNFAPVSSKSPRISHSPAER